MFVLVPLLVLLHCVPLAFCQEKQYYDAVQEPTDAKESTQNIPVKFFEEVRTTVTHNIHKNHLITNVYLEDLYDLANLTSYPQMTTITMNLALVPEGNFSEFYSRCIKNLQRMGPNLTKIYFTEAKNMVVIEDNVYENLKSESEKIVEDANSLKRLFEERKIKIVELRMMTEVLIQELAMKLDRLNELFSTNVTADFALVYGFISNSSLGDINLQTNYVFSTTTLFNSPENKSKYNHSVLTEKIPTVGLPMRRRIEARLPQRCIRPLMANSIACLAAPDRMTVTKTDGKDDQSVFCCEFF